MNKTIEYSRQCRCSQENLLHCLNFCPILVKCDLERCNHHAEFTNVFPVGCDFVIRSSFKSSIPERYHLKCDRLGEKGDNPINHTCKGNRIIPRHYHITAWFIIGVHGFRIHRVVCRNLKSHTTRWIPCALIPFNLRMTLSPLSFMISQMPGSSCLCSRLIASQPGNNKSLPSFFSFFSSSIRLVFNDFRGSFR